MVMKIQVAQAALSGAKANWNYTPAQGGGYASFHLADLNGDGKLDLMIGNIDGSCSGYRNTGTNANPVWTAEVNWNTPDKGSYAFPAFADLDNDGDKDLLIGGWNYSVAYKNTGNADAPVWTEQASWQPRMLITILIIPWLIWIMTGTWIYWSVQEVEQFMAIGMSVTCLILHGKQVTVGICLIWELMLALH